MSVVFSNIYIATLFAGDEAILLPELYYYFCQKINQNLHKFQNVDVSLSKKHLVVDGYSLLLVITWEVH